jgi:uncharacterized protein (DUF1015 family)
MADIFPFKALRPKPDYAQSIASVPYDVVNRVEAKALAKDNPNSFLNVVRPEIGLDDSVSPYDSVVYQRGLNELQRLIQSGLLVQDQKDCFYVYRQKMGEHTQHGLVVCVSAQDYFDEKIKKHELTREDKEQDRIRHVLKLNANTGPVFLTYKDQGQFAVFQKVISQVPVYDFTAVDGISHTVWVIDSDEDIKAISESFKTVPCSYIADGHHRSAAGAKAALKKAGDNPNHTGKEEYNRYLAILFPHDQLKILDYNRALKTLNGFTKTEVLNKLKSLGSLELKTKEAKPQATHQVGVYIDHEWYLFTFSKDLYKDVNEVDALDVALLQNHVLNPVFGIQDPRTSHAIDFVGGIRGLGELQQMVDSNSHAIAFALFPTSISELMAIADAGKIMPPKSTWFEPKLRSGLLVHLLD